MNIQSLSLSIDLNRDGRYSVWELWEALKFIYRLPGNLLVEGLGHIPPIASLLNIDATPANGYGSLDGLLSVTISLLFWVVVIFGMLTLASPSTDADDDMPGASPRNLAHGDNPTKFISTPFADGASASVPLQRPRMRRHLPVSRPLYAASGKKPKRHPWHHIAASLFRQVKP